MHTKMFQRQYAAEKITIERVEMTQIVTKQVVVTMILSMAVMEWITKIGTCRTAFPKNEFICKYAKL